MDSSISTVLGQGRVEGCIREVNGVDACDQWVSRLNTILSEPVASFSEADQIRTALRGILTWENCANQLMRHVNSVLDGPEGYHNQFLRMEVLVQGTTHS